VFDLANAPQTLVANLICWTSEKWLRPAIANEIPSEAPRKHAAINRESANEQN
jgi:hypothetical protein